MRHSEGRWRGRHGECREPRAADGEPVADHREDRGQGHQDHEQCRHPPERVVDGLLQAGDAGLDGPDPDSVHFLQGVDSRHLEGRGDGDALIAQGPEGGDALFLHGRDSGPALTGDERQRVSLQSVTNSRVRSRWGVHRVEYGTAFVRRQLPDRPDGRVHESGHIAEQVVGAAGYGPQLLDVTQRALHVVRAAYVQDQQLGLPAASFGSCAA